MDCNVWRSKSAHEYLTRIRRVRFGAQWLTALRTGSQPSARLDQPIEQLNASCVPILMLHGREDMIFPVGLALRAADSLDNASVVVLEEAGHMSHIDDPTGWLDAIVAFVST